MENGICSLREIGKLCRNDIRYMYLLDGMKTPSFATFGNLIRNELTDSVVPLMEKFNRTYGHYPKYPVADTGYGSYNNYLYCEEHGMEKYIKFTMYKKETTDKKYHENPYRAVNFAKDADGNLLCPNGRKFLFYILL